MMSYVVKDARNQVLAEASSYTDAVMKCVAIKCTDVLTAVFCVNHARKKVMLSAVYKDGNRKDIFTIGMKDFADTSNLTEEEIIEQSLKMFNDFNKQGWGGSIGYFFDCKID